MVNFSTDSRPIHAIDASDRVVFVNAAWSAWMRSESRPDTTLDAAMGTPIWNYVDGPSVRQLWEVLYDRVRAVGAPLFVPKRVDTASTRRLFDMEIYPLADYSIRHIAECVWSEPRAAVALLDPAYPRDSRTILQCAWCARAQVRLGHWEEIEKAQRVLGIEATETLPTVKAGSCSQCQQSLLKNFPARVA